MHDQLKALKERKVENLKQELNELVLRCNTIRREIAIIETELSRPNASNIIKQRGIGVDKDIFNTEEAAEILQVKPTTLEQWRWNGKGPRFVKLGRCVRYRRADLEAFMDGRTYTSTTQSENLDH